MAPNTKGQPAPVAQRQATNGSAHPTISAATPTSSEPTTINRKKQKRRQKQAAQAAKLAAEQPTSQASTSLPQRWQQNGYSHPPHPSHEPVSSWSAASDADAMGQSDADDQYESRDEEEFYSEAEGHMYDSGRIPAPASSVQSKKQKKRGRSFQHEDYQDPYGHPSMPGGFHHNHNHHNHHHHNHHHAPPPPPPPARSNQAVRTSSHGNSKDRIWNTSTAEERERIKEFWLSLEEKDRRSLVKVEKEAVLKKMKEQQRNSCSCTICGRKRTAIEEELEVLYDAYYEELEQYANHQHVDGTILPPPGAYPPMPRPRSYPPPHLHGGLAPKGRIMEQFDDEEGDDEEYSDEEDSEGYYDDDPRGPATEFFNFGNSLTVQSGILTVADDLLKNDGKKFIEMMEQLAERRMAREKMHTRYEPPPMRQPSYQDQGPPLDDEEDYEDDDAEYDESGEEYEDEEEMEAMSEEQRMEEGRRMFQIFAARMFEQRVLTAYREKVAKERQERLIEELNDEDNQKAQREAKKAKEAQKKKDKKKQQKAAKEEERLKKEAEKEAELAALKAVEEKKQEEQRTKREAARKKKEAEKKAQEEEKQRKEAERQARIREQQAEVDRRQKEARDKEKKRKEDAKKKQLEEREKELKAKKEKEAAEVRERETKAEAKRAFAESRKEEQSRQVPPVPVVPSLTRKTSAVIPSVPPGLQATSSNHASPHLQVATPVIPKAPSPVKPRQASQQGSHHSSPKSSQGPSDSSATSAGSVLPQQTQPPPGITMPAKMGVPVASTRPTPTSIVPPPGIQPPYFPTTSSPMPGNAFNPGFNGAPGMLPRFPGPEPHMYGQQPFHPPGFRSQPPPAHFGYPPGINIPRQNMHKGRGSPVDAGTPQAPIGSAAPGSYPSSHMRQLSGSYDRPPGDHAVTQPIARPAPIERPSSLPHRDDNDVDELNTRLGSSALLEGTDDGPGLNHHEPRGGMAPGGPRPSHGAFGPSPVFPSPLHARMNNFAPPGMSAGSTWGSPLMQMGTPVMSSQPSWSASPGPPGWSNNTGFGAVGGVGAAGAQRLNPAQLRSLACLACRQLSTVSAGKDGYESIEVIMQQMQQMKGLNDKPIIESDLIKVLEAEGSQQNGGGFFQIQYQNGTPFAKYEPTSPNLPFGGGRLAGPPGDIGSPVPPNAVPFGGRGFPIGHHP